MSSRIADYEELRCIVCGQRFYSWGELAPHERQCKDDAEAKRRDEFAERQLRDLGYPVEGDLP